MTAPEPTAVEPVVVLDAETLTPQSVLVPCPSSEVAYLGVQPRGARVWCGFLAGHEGDHEFKMTWRDA